MSKSYTPGLKIVDKAEISKNRLLPLSGKVHVNENEKVTSNCIVASTEIPGNVQMLNVANQLNIDPEQTSSCMLVNVGDDIKKGQVIAKSKGLFGLFQSEIKSPLDGKIGNISDVTGQVIISEPPFPIEIDAYLSGKVSKVFNKEGVEIKAKGTFIQGIIGIGGEKKGILKVIDNNDGKFYAIKIQDKCKVDYLELNMVSKISDQKVGYLHVDKMRWDNLEKFRGEIFSHGFDRDAMIIDVRNNTGGFTADRMLYTLMRPLHANTVPRGGINSYPQGYLEYPFLVLG